MLRWRRAIIADERGLALIFVALGFLAFVSAAMLAVDVGMFMVARTQAQNSADAGALAGAVPWCSTITRIARRRVPLSRAPSGRQISIRSWATASP